MSHGFQVYDDTGALTLSATDKITRVIHTRYLPASETDSVTLTDFDYTKGWAFVFPADKTISPLGATHVLSVGVNSVSWAPNTSGVFANGPCWLVVVMYE